MPFLFNFICFIYSVSVSSHSVTFATSCISGGCEASRHLRRGALTMSSLAMALQLSLISSNGGKL